MPEGGGGRRQEAGGRETLQLAKGLLGGVDASMAGNEGTSFASRESFSFRDMRDYLSRKAVDGDEDVVLRDFVSLCKAESPRFSNVKSLRLDCRRLGHDGMHALGTFLGGGYISGLRGLRIVMGLDAEAQDVREAFGEIFQSDSLNDVTSLELECWSTEGNLQVETSVYEAFAQALLLGQLNKLESLKCLQFHKKNVKSFGLVELHRSFGSLFDNLSMVFGLDCLASLLELDLFIGGAAKDTDGLVTLFEKIPTSLKVLRLSGRDSVDAAEPLVEALTAFPSDSLKEIDLRNSFAIKDNLRNGFARDSESNLRNSLRRENQIRESKLRKILAREKTIMSLALAIQSGHAKNLEILDLSSNEIGDEEADALAKAFNSGNLTTLRVLHLQENEIGLRGVESIFQSFESGKCPRLNHLDLSTNNFQVDDSLLRALAKVLESGNLSCLEHFDMRQPTRPTHSRRDESPDRAAGMTEIARVFRTCSLPKLEKLILFSTGVEMDNLPKEVRDNLVNSYRNNPSLIACMWPGFADLRTPVCQRRELASLQLRNRERLQTMKSLEEEADVPGEHGKVFLCGNPGVGKTTLRKTLTKYKARQGSSLRLWRSGQQAREPTRGIETTNIESKGMSLVLWDMVGQQEYEVLRSAFLPDLSFVDGKSTFFVIVCKANDFKAAKAQLYYWLKFISSNSVEGISQDRKRRVFVIANCVHGKKDGVRDVEDWVRFLTEYQNEFGKFLNLQNHPWIMDVKGDKDVRAFRKKILEEAQQEFQSRRMPKICQSVREHGMRWVKDNELYPVLPWDAYRQVMGPNCAEENLAAAAEYLHEAGLIILFRRPDTIFDPGGAASTSQTTRGSLVIVDPQWFCQKVVGNFLLPDSFLTFRHEGQEPDILRSSLANEEIPLPISVLEKTELKVPRNKIDEAVVLLSHFGICYLLQDRADAIFVPDLITGIDLPGWSDRTWKRDAGAWVMGFSLKVKNDKEAFLPIAALRHLQVDLVRDKNVGCRHDSDFLATRCATSFKYKGMLVLIEYSDKAQDRIDVLVRPSVDTSFRREQMLDVVQEFATRREQISVAQESLTKREQIYVAQEFVTRVLRIVGERCRNVELQKHIVKPWSVAEGPKSSEARYIKLSAGELKEKIESDGGLRTMDWTVGNVRVEEEDVLSNCDLSSLLGDILKKRALTQEAIRWLNCSNIIESGNSTDNQSKPETSAEDLTREDHDVPDPDPDTFQEMARFIDKKFTKMFRMHNDMRAGMREELGEILKLQKCSQAILIEVKGGIRSVLESQKSLNLQIQNLGRFNEQEKELSVPRFAFLTRKGSSNWLVRSRILQQETVILHFLCEASYSTGNFHEVESQEGVDIRSFQGWAKKLLPVLVWTLKVTFVTAKIAGNVVLPGLGILFNEGPLNNLFQRIVEMTPGVADSSKRLSEALDDAFEQYLSQKLSEVGMGKGLSKYAPGSELELRGNLRAAIGELLYDRMSVEDRHKRLGLRRVRLDGETIMWICTKCHRLYGRRAQEF